MGNSCSGSNPSSSHDIKEPQEALHTYTRTEVAKHNTPEDCWIVIDNIVYDVSQYWKVHPGGGDYIKRWAGKDATLAFREFNHTPFAEAQLASLGAEVGQVEIHGKFERNLYEETPLPKATKDIEHFAEKSDMMCFQCQQTVKGTGCTDMGVCGKNPTIAALQDLLVHYLKGISQYAVKVDQSHWNEDLMHTFLHVFFMTLTNVNFNEKKHFVYLKKCADLRDQLRKIYEESTPEDKRDTFLVSPNSPSSFVYKDDQAYLFEQSRATGLNARKQTLDPNIFGLLEMAVYGLKGGAAYMYHAECIRNNVDDPVSVYTEEQRKEVFKGLFEVTAGLTDPAPTLERFIQLNMDVGKSNFGVMQFLDDGHNKAFGKPTPNIVNRAPVEGKCILISGHDMMVLKKLLIQTEGTGVNIYTHGEMLPAFGYPELRKFKHLVGNFGTAWYNQTNEFPDFPGAILLNSNCLIQPQPSYAKRIFTTHIVGWDDIKHIEGDDFSEVIECAKKQPGFKKNSRQFKKYEHVESEMTGYGHASMAELLVPEIKAGNLKEIYLIGGCDNLDPTRSKYLQRLLELPKTTIILTLGCAKFRLFGYKEKLGYLPGDSKIPRLIDVGQCNDAYSAVKVALALTEVLGVGVNDLPLHLMLSWVEQKAVVILLTLLHLGIKNINIGPNLPAYLTPTLLNYLIENFALSPMALPIQENILYPLKAPLAEGKPKSYFRELGDFEPCSFVRQTEVAKNTYKFTFAFANSESTCDLQPGQHVVFRARDIHGKYITRAYTPINSVGNKGGFDIIVKVYEQGLFSNFLKSLEVGQSVEAQGPCGSTVYSQEKDNSISLKEDLATHQKVKSINMVTGGTSCVSMYQIVQSLVNNNHEVNCNVIVANSKKDLKVLENEFQDLVRLGKDRVKVLYITSDVEGRISKEIFEKNLIAHGADQNVVNLIAGPHTFRQAAKGIFDSLGHNKNNLVQFY